MKRLLTLATLLLCSLLTFAQFSGSGSGTESDPYLIYNETQLSQMANFLDQDGVVFSLKKNLDLTSWIAENSPSQGWQPIGVESSPFCGKLLGNGYTISGLKISREAQNYVGFFGYINCATISDLTIKGTNVAGSQYTGFFAGRAENSTLTNINVEGVSITGSSYCGGLIGYANATSVTNFRVELNSTNPSSIKGGLAGYAQSCTFSSGTITGSFIGGNQTGGVVGKSESSLTLNSVIMNGDITSTDETGKIGGLVGSAFGTLDISASSHNGNVSGAANVGGLVGILETGSSATLATSKSKGTITNDGDNTGGLIGKNNASADLESCSHFGEIHGSNYVGGLIGAILGSSAPVPELYTREVWEGISNGEPSGELFASHKDILASGSTITKSINNCVAIGNISGLNYVGGLVGSDVSSISYSPSDVEFNVTSGYSSLYLFVHNYDNIESSKLVYYKKESNLPYYCYYYYHAYYKKYTKNVSICNLSNSYYNGEISGSEYVGGVVGQKTVGDIKNCYAYGSIIGSDYVGGVAGMLSGQSGSSSTSSSASIKSCTSNCLTISATASNAKVGRIYGDIENITVIGSTGTNEGNRALSTCKLIQSGVTQVVSDDAQNGLSTGPSLLKLKATYVSMGWDFDNDWKILETECFPYKTYQAAPPVIGGNLVSGATSISGQSLDGGTVYLIYKDQQPVSTTCSGNDWAFQTEALQSGARVQVYADVEGKTPSYYTMANVGFLGSGTQDDPYRIYTADDLQGVSKVGYYKLMNDIDLTSWIADNSPTKGWVPIGLNSGDGTYIDGDNHKVTGLWINTSDDYTGLFSNYSAGEIKNLNVEVATGKKVKGGNYTGILIGRMANGVLSNCTVKGDVEGGQYVGGIAGYTSSTSLTMLEAEGKVSGSSYVGGLTGYATSKTSHSNATSTITASGDNVGGLIGYSADIENSWAAATITSSGPSSHIGGLAGYGNGAITKSQANANVATSGTDNYVGGLVGYATGNVSLSFSSGTISATGNGSHTGGLVGYASNTSVTNCYSTANVSGTMHNAGLVAYALNTSIDKCYAKGNITGVNYGGGVVSQLDGSSAALTNSVAANNTISLSASSSWGSRVIGGFKNGAADPDESNFALNTMQVSLNGVPQIKTDDPVEGIAKPATELMSAVTYMGIGWDYSSIWGIDEGEIYPYLLWEIDINPVVEISLDKTQMLIAVGNSETITASILPLGATNKRLEWTSSNPDVATVEGGNVTAVAVGTAVITATATDGSGVSAACEVTVVANKDAAIAQLQSIVDYAQDLYDNSTEGENIGEYATGSRAALLVVINNVQGRISSTMSDEDISECTAQINAAIAQFNSQQVTAGEDTDYSQIDNTIYLERVETAAGGQLTLSVKMKNTIEVQGYQFDLYLPQGVSFATDDEGFVLAELSTERTTPKKMNSFDAAIQADGSLRVLCGSSKGYTFDGTDGEVALITLNIDADIAEGEHPLILKTVKLSDRNSVPYSTDYLKSTLVISSYTLGDVNADKSIDVADYIAVANYILGNPPDNFVSKAADINEDNSIDVADYIGVANLILNGAVVAHAPSIARTMAKIPRKTATDISTLDDAIYVAPITAAPGTQQELSIQMKNSSNVVGFEFSLKLPDGITVALDGDDMPMAELSTERTTAKRTTSFDSAIQPDGTLKVLCGTTAKNSATGKLYTFNGNEGEVARITINIPANYASGVYDVSILDALFADENSHKTTLQSEINSELTIGDNTIVLDENSTAVPTATSGDVNIKVKRTISANMWNTICLPFDMTSAQVYEAFGNDVLLAEFDSYDAEYDTDENVKSLTLNFVNADLSNGLYANCPYIIKTSADISEFDVMATLSPDEENAVSEYDNGKTGKRREVYGTFYGTYHANTVVPSNALFISANKFYYSTGNTKMKAFRAYFILEDVLSSVGGSESVSMKFNDVQTGISHILSNSKFDAYYDLQGRRVLHPTNGVYIKSGKKVYVK